MHGVSNGTLIHAGRADPPVIDVEPYGAYSSSIMAKARRKGAEEARAQLPALLEDAAQGRTTIITRRGRSIAALVPVSEATRQKGLVDLIGSGKGLWGARARTLRRLRDEWSR